MASTTPSPSWQIAPSPSANARYASRGMPNPTGRTAEAARDRTLRRDKDNYTALRDRSKKHIENGPYKLRPPVKISTKTIDTDTIGRLNKANQRMSQFLYNLANEPSVGLYHVNDHIRRTVPRLVTVRKDIDFHKVEMDKSSCDVEEILPTVRTIGSLTAFKSMQSLLQKSIQLASPKPASSSASASSKSLGPPSPSRSPASTSPNTSMRQIDTSFLSASNAGHTTPQSNPPPNVVSVEIPITTSDDHSIATTSSQVSQFPIASPASDTISTPHEPQEEANATHSMTKTSEMQQEPTSTTEDISVSSAQSANRPVLDPFGGQMEDVVEVDLSPSETPLSQEELILGNRAPGSKKKKRQEHQSDSLVPKEF